MDSNQFQIPEWLAPPSSPPNHSGQAPPKPRSQLTPEERALEQQTFAIAFEALLEQMANAIPFDVFCRTYFDPLGRCLSASRFRAWIFVSPSRKSSYYGAKVLAAEAIEDELIRIADGINADGSLSLTDPARAKLMVETRWKLLPIYNRARYAQTTQIEQTTNITMKSMESMSAVELKRLILERHAPHLAASRSDPSMDGADPGDEPTPDPDEPEPEPDEPGSDLLDPLIRP